METVVYLSGRDIKIVVGKANNNRFVLKDFFSLPMPEGCMINGMITDDFEITGLIRKMWKDNSLSKKNVHIVVDSSAFMLKTLTVPVTSTANLLTIIKNEFKDNDSNNSSEEILCDYAVHEPSLEEGGASVLAFGVEKSFISSYVELFTNAVKGVKIKSIVPSQYSCINFMNYSKKVKDKTVIAAFLDGNILSLMLFVNGKYRFSNRARLINERCTPESADELAGAISYIIQFNRAERNGHNVSDVWFFGTIPGEEEILENIRLFLPELLITDYPFANEVISHKNKYYNKPEEFVYCIGCLP